MSVRPKNYLGINFSQIKEILFVGYPAALEQVVFQFGITAFLILVSYYGTDAYAAYGIGVQILSFSFVIGFGFSIAGATLVGQHLGALDVNQADYIVKGFLYTYSFRSGKWVHAIKST